MVSDLDAIGTDLYRPGPNRRTESESQLSIPPRLHYRPSRGLHHRADAESEDFGTKDTSSTISTGEAVRRNPGCDPATEAEATFSSRFATPSAARCVRDHGAEEAQGKERQREG